MLFAKSFSFGQNQAEVKIDSAEIKKYAPSKEAEEKVFSDPKLKYDHKVVAAKGIFDKLLEWLSKKLFGNASYDNISSARSIIIWTIVVIAVIVIIWLLSKSEMGSLIRPKPKATAFSFSDITEDLDTINFDTKIKEAASNGDYRLAIRWHYLKMLFLLDKKGLISFAPFKTNIDYTNELKNKKFTEGFVKFSRIYEYVWYGQFTLNEITYKGNASDFETFEKEINV